MRERERTTKNEKKENLHTNTYIYIYREREREKLRGGPSGADGTRQTGNDWQRIPRRKGARPTDSSSTTTSTSTG